MKPTNPSAREELEARRVQAQKMEAIGRLAGGIAHDFNNLLTAIKGHAGILIDDLPAESTARKEAAQILQVADRAAAMTRHLLAFSRKQVLEERRVDLCGCVVDMETMLRRLIPERIEFVVDVPPEQTTVCADPNQLSQVVMNLVVNAADAIADAGRVTVRVGSVRLTSAEANDFPWHVNAGPYSTLTVTDTGEGMAPDVLENVFEPFYTTKPEGRGTGLGLATVYGIVKQSRGHILVETELGQGTTFQVLLPRDEGAPDPPPHPDLADEPDEAGVILLVEDDDAVRNILCRVLDRAGYNLLVAENGKEAIAIADQYGGSIGLVVSDVVMPELGGLELQRRLQKSHPHFRMILTSGYSEAEVQEEVRKKADAFLAKPFTPRELEQAVVRVLGQGKT